MRNLILLSILILYSINVASAQKRFEDDNFFKEVTVTKNVQYGANIPFLKSNKEPLFMDVYEPKDDPAEQRPLIILIHAGSFLDTTTIGFFNSNKPLGSKHDNWIVSTATRLAQKGYVVASIDHRVGWNFTAGNQEELGKSIFRAVWRGMADFKACVRFFRLDRNSKNIFRIDPNRIAAGGSSSGGYLPIHAQTLNKSSELEIEKFLGSDGKSFIDTLEKDLGNFKGIAPDNALGSCLSQEQLAYPYNIRAILSIGGAVGDTSIIEPGDPVIIATHGITDKSTPYKTSIVQTAIGNKPIIEVSGSHDMVSRSQNLGNQKILKDAGFIDKPFIGLKPFSGVGFEPFSWYNNSTQSRKDSALVYLDSLINFITPRLYVALDLKSFSSTENTYNIEANISPNPTQQNIKIVMPKVQNYDLAIYNLLGQKVYSSNFVGNEHFINLENLPEGIYNIQLKDYEGGYYHDKVIKN